MQKMLAAILIVLTGCASPPFRESEPFNKTYEEMVTLVAQVLEKQGYQVGSFDPEKNILETKWILESGTDLDTKQRTKVQVQFHRLEGRKCKIGVLALVETSKEKFEDWSLSGHDEAREEKIIYTLALQFTQLKLHE